MSTAAALKDRIKELRVHMQQLSSILVQLEPTLNVLEEQEDREIPADTCSNDSRHSAEFLEVITKTSGCIQEFNKGIESFEKVFGHLCDVTISETARIRESGATSREATIECLTNDDIARYSRQLILPEFGVAAQLKLKKSAFLIVGMGGLGCPAAQYLLAAGCGRIGLVDYDLVERSNFHRQTLHTEHFIGQPKVDSAKASLMQINPNCRIDTHQLLLNSVNALPLLEQYDLIIDCTDNVATRYLLNDACVMLNKTLISGSAIQLDGQLTVYHYGDGPCYRCLFPVPPPPETVTNCGDGGVLGAVTGVIGSLQALEAIKVATGVGEVLSGRLLIFDANRCIFRNIKLRNKRSDCDICSATPLITRLINYEQFCGMHASDKDHALSLLTPSQRISVFEYKEQVQLHQQPHLLLDVRSAAEFEICQLPQAVNVPLKQLLNDGEVTERLRAELVDKKLSCIVYCRRGNDSQIAVQHLQNKFADHQHIKDIAGGLHAWHNMIDKDFPIY